jgi:hypothetical protein
VTFGNFGDYRLKNRFSKSVKSRKILEIKIHTTSNFLQDEKIAQRATFCKSRKICKKEIFCKKKFMKIPTFSS